jgi:hypothetical protein
VITIFCPDVIEPLTADERLFLAVCATIDRMKTGLKNANTARAKSAVLDRIENDLREVAAWPAERRQAARDALLRRGIAC